MLFAKDKEIYRGKKLQYDDLETVIIKYKSRGYLLDVKKLRVKEYCKVGRGYIGVDVDESSKIMEIFQCFLLNKNSVKKALPMLPFGAAWESYMQFVFEDFDLFYIIESKLAWEKYLELLNILDEYCNPSFSGFIYENRGTSYPEDVVEHLNIGFGSENIQRIVGYRYEATVVFGYEFYIENKKICDASNMPILLCPWKIKGFHRSWESEFDLDSTILPGLTRYVHDEGTGSEIARLVYISDGKYEINDAVKVYCNALSYAFFREDELFARIEKFKGKAEWMPPSNGYEYEAYFDIALKDGGISEEMKMLILTFPLLRFAF